MTENPDYDSDLDDPEESATGQEGPEDDLPEESEAEADDYDDSELGGEG